MRLLEALRMRLGSWASLATIEQEDAALELLHCGHWEAGLSLLRARRYRLKDHRDLQIAFYADGPDAFIEAAADYSANTIRRAVYALRPGGDVEDLKAELMRLGYQIGNGSPDMGDSRAYSVQETGGRHWVRLPVDSLDLAAGDKVLARYYSGSVTVEPLEETRDVDQQMQSPPG